VSSPDLGPTESVQHAANIYARELARGTPLAEIPGMHPAKFGHLTRAELAEARRYGVQANVFRQAVEDLPPGAPISDIPEYVALPPGGGLWDVTFRGEARTEEGGAARSARTVLVAVGPGQSRQSILDVATEEVYLGENWLSPELDDYTIAYVPFNTHED
jgi:hypothetical protein